MNRSNQQLKTDRLLLTSLELDDRSFILELVNSEGWLTFIGDRNVRSLEDASAYIEKIQNEPTVTYWVVKLQNETQIGVVTLIQREYLPLPDIGFAFLPDYQGKGYAFEACEVVLNDLRKHTDFPSILAITNPENAGSIRLIERLGFSFDKREVQDGKDTNQYQLDFRGLY